MHSYCIAKSTQPLNTPGEPRTHNQNKNDWTYTRPDGAIKSGSGFSLLLIQRTPLTSPDLSPQYMQGQNAAQVPSGTRQRSPQLCNIFHVSSMLAADRPNTQRLHHHLVMPLSKGSSQREDLDDCAVYNTFILLIIMKRTRVHSKVRWKLPNNLAQCKKKKKRP